jgi:DNA-binding CsgD family transcriptional regulator
MTRTTGDQETFSELVGLLYDTSSDPVHWHAALKALRKEFRASYAIAILAPDSGCGDGISLILSENEFSSIPGFAHLDSHNCPFASIAPRDVAAISDLMEEAEWIETPFYRLVTSPDGVGDILCIEIRLEDRSVYRMRFTRDVGADRFGDAERQFATLLVPHLTRAFRMGRQLARYQLLQERFATACDRLGVAMIVLDSKGHVIEQNAAAAQILSDEDGLTLRRGQLYATYPGENFDLQRALRKALSETAKIDDVAHVMAISRESTPSIGLLIQSIPYAQGLRAGASRPSAIVFIRDPEHRIANGARTAQILYQLTQAESAVVMLLANGSSIQEAADTMNIQLTTARTHLRSIFNKLGVSRQSDLVRQVLNSVTLLADDSDSRAPAPHRAH